MATRALTDDDDLVTYILKGRKSDSGRVSERTMRREELVETTDLHLGGKRSGRLLGDELSNADGNDAASRPMMPRPQEGQFGLFKKSATRGEADSLRGACSPVDLRVLGPESRGRRWMSGFERPVGDEARFRSVMVGGDQAVRSRVKLASADVLVRKKDSRVSDSRSESS